MSNETFSYTKRFQQRFARESDAAFILELRLDPEKSKFLSKVENNLDAQKSWLRDYQTREATGQEYYFIIEETESAEPMGLVRVYDIDKEAGTFEWGSWIMKNGAPPTAAIESAISVYEFAFSHLGLTKCHFKVFKENERVVQFHRRFGASETHSDDENQFFDLTIEDYQNARTRFARFLKN